MGGEPHDTFEIVTPRVEQEITYNPGGVEMNGIEAAPSAQKNLRTALAITANHFDSRINRELPIDEDGKIHLTTQLAMCALFGMNVIQWRLSDQAVDTERLSLQRRQLAQALLQKMFSRGDLLHGVIVEELLGDNTILGKILAPETDMGKLDAFREWHESRYQAPPVKTKRNLAQRVRGAALKPLRKQ